MIFFNFFILYAFEGDVVPIGLIKKILIKFNAMKRKEKKRIQT